MSAKKVLFISWQACLGHVTRDVAIARQIHELLPEVELVWLASPMATQVLEETGEEVLPESAQSADYNTTAKHTVGCFSVSLTKYVRVVKELYDYNVELYKQIVDKYQFDLVIGDEIYELAIAVLEKRLDPLVPLIMIRDFIGFSPMSWGPLERLLVTILNRQEAHTLTHPALTHLFVGEPEDIPDQRAGLFLPNWRDIAEQHVEFLGYPLRFSLDDYRDKSAIRARLGYGPEPLVVCALGGASVGVELLKLCGQAYPLIKEHVPDLRMIAVGGMLFDPASISLPPDVTVEAYVPDLFEHFAASDLSIVVGGGTSTTELTALRRPFIYFPLEKQLDQQIHIARRLNPLVA
ncbi:MAG: hypothetical protein HOC74_13530 [Gemmatimonadetes bacterium]|jgi:hypothetical protein|nr:hypothetical protein [Gemmatimonadota bacterium]